MSRQVNPPARPLPLLPECRVGWKTKFTARNGVRIACVIAVAFAHSRSATAQSRLPSARRMHVTPAQHALPAPHPQESVSAGPAHGLTLEDLEHMALAGNPTLAQAAAKVRAAQGQWLQAGLQPNPIIGYQGTEIGNEGRAGQQGGFLSQEIVRPGKLQLARLANSRAVAQAQAEFAAQRLRVLNDVRAEYFNVLVAQRAVELTRELASLGRSALSTTEQLFRGEQIAYVDVLQARIEANSAEISVENARNRHVAAWRRLSSVVGVPDMVPLELIGKLEPPADDLKWEDSLGRLLSESPELAAAGAGVARARAQLAREQVEPRPNLDIQLGVQYDNASQSTISNVQLGVPVPILNRNQGNVQTALADLRSAQAEVGRVELSLRARLASAFETYANARSQVEKYTRDILPDARQSLDLVTKGFQQQQFSFLTLLTAQRTFAQANLAYLQALQQLGTSRVAIDGMLLGGSLREERALDVPRVETGVAPVFGPARPPVERN